MREEYAKGTIVVYSRINKKGVKQYAKFERIWNGVNVQRTPWVSLKT